MTAHSNVESVQAVAKHLRRLPVTCSTVLTRAQLREARWPSGVACPRCGSSGVQRWCRTRGGGQRYRCRRGCGRTFSDLTGTPLAYTKRFDSWAEAAKCMMWGGSVRETARRAGLSPATAFRWRHKILRSIHRVTARGILSGIIEIHVLHVWESFKGSTPPNRPPRRRALSWPERHERSRHIAAIIARDRRGGRADLTLGEAGSVSAGWLARGLEDRIALPAIVCSPYRQGFAAYCRRAGIANECPGGRRHGSASLTLFHNHRAAAAGRSFGSWLRRFHGVATKYLQHYLSWHELLDRTPGTSGTASRDQLILTGCIGTPIVA
jgi:transposase-like protein